MPPQALRNPLHNFKAVKVLFFKQLAQFNTAIDMTWNGAQAFFDGASTFNDIELMMSPVCAKRAAGSAVARSISTT
jgi:hypothetical protein